MTRVVMQKAMGNGLFFDSIVTHKTEGNLHWLFIFLLKGFLSPKKIIFNVKLPSESREINYTYGCLGDTVVLNTRCKIMCLAYHFCNV